MNITSKKIKQHSTLFTVKITNKNNTHYSWDFIVSKQNNIMFAGKSIVQRKKIGKKLYKASEIQSKPVFTIEPDFMFPHNDYIYLPKHFYVSSIVEVRGDSYRPEKSILTWFSNIPPLLFAIENKDSLLAAELFQKKTTVFMQFPVITMKLLESISVEGLFSWIWGRFDKKSMLDLQAIFEGKCTKQFLDWNVAEAFFTAARRRLDIKQTSTESLDDCITRYIKSNSGTKITLGIVGSNHYRWVEKALFKQQDNITRSNDFFSATKSFLQAETDNQFDQNAIALYLENTVSGYIRKTGAELLRKALPEKRVFSSRLARLGYTKSGKTGIVVEIVV